MGLIDAAVQNIIATAVLDPELDVRCITAHVWTENEEGLNWYKGRGFTRGDQPIKGYYLKLRPDSAFFVRRDVGASVRSSLPSSSTASSTKPVAASATAAVVNLPRMGAPPKSSSARPSPPSRSAQSFQNQRPDVEWNDLPQDMAPGLLAPPKSGSEPASGATSRSSSMVRKKRDRSYPAAAFGGDKKA
ncbi:hypothetical protein G7046_g10107 [Stylonectria norvegica]|nr:hypothetical protein G7046_g10107 [Stylonectria norvegica]